MRNPESLAWLKAGDFAAWRTELRSPEAIAHVNDFLATYGHRAVHEGEFARPRWSEDVSLLMQAVLVHCEEPRKIPVKASVSAHLQKLLDMLPSSARKQGEQTIQKLGELHKLQSNALQSLAYIGAGTRSWALAAAREAMVDKRLHSTDEVFCFELEEIKQMMTGEWNISSLDEIRDTTVKRQMEHAAAKQEVAPDILVGDDEAFVSHQGLPGVVGKATAPLCLLDTLRLDTTEKQDCRGAIVATELLDSGCVLTLPLAAGLVATAGTPCDPFVIAAHSWQRPVVVSMAKNSVELAEGASIAVEVTTDTAKVSRL
jgi:pyruvate,water dikinase